MYQVLPYWMLAVRSKGRDAPCGPQKSGAVARTLRIQERWCLRSSGRRRHRGDLCAARCNCARDVWWIAERPSHPGRSRLMERPAEMVGRPGDIRRLDRDDRPFLPLRSKGRSRRRRTWETGEAPMIKVRWRKLDPEHVSRYTFHERAIHFIVAVTCVYLVLSGLALNTPFLFWMSSLLGGPAPMRLFHPILGLLYFIFLVYM